jgi:hypothetical protein
MDAMQGIPVLSLTNEVEWIAGELERLVLPSCGVNTDVLGFQSATPTAESNAINEFAHKAAACRICQHSVALVCDNGNLGSGTLVSVGKRLLERFTLGCSVSGMG